MRHEARSAFLAGASFKFALGQLVALKSGHTGHIRALLFDFESGLPQAEIALLQPIVIPARGEYSRLEIWRQYQPLHDLIPVDETAEIRRQLFDSLVEAEAFIRGFEDDELQDGIEELLGRIRTALRAAER